MGFINFLGSFFVRVIFFIGGFIVFITGGAVMNIGSTVKSGFLAPAEINPFFGILGLIIVLVGIAMMIYAFKT
jgi:hypothetical protein